MEGVTLGLAYGLARFRELGIQPTEIRLTGGGSKSAVWRQIAADIFGVPTICLASAEGAALGAAIQAAYASQMAHGQPVTFRELCEQIREARRSHPRQTGRRAQGTLRRAPHPPGRPHAPAARGGLSVMKLVIAATGASGAIYLQRLLAQIDCRGARSASRPQRLREAGHRARKSATLAVPDGRAAARRQDR